MQEHPNDKLNIEINKKKSETIEEMVTHSEKEEIAAENFFTGTRTRTDKENLEIITETYEKGIKIKESSGFYDKEYGKVNKVTTFDPDTKKRVSVEFVGDIKGSDGTIIKKDVVFKRTVFDPVTSKPIEEYTQDHQRFEIWKNLEVFNPKTGKAVSEYFCYMGNIKVKNFEADGDTIKSSISIAAIRTKNFEEAVKLFKKYASLSDDEILKLYRQKLENPADISELEFKILQGNHDLRFDTEPLISDATVVSKHGEVNRYNSRVRDFVKDGMKDADEIERLQPRINKIDKEFANLPPLEKDCVFYRGLADKYIPDVINGKIGDVVVPDEGYAYGAFHRELASQFAQTMLVIRTPKGAKISRCGAHGGETLYPRGAEFKILSKNKGPDGKNIIELEYILPKS